MKLARFAARLPLPIAALPSVSLTPSARLTDGMLPESFRACFADHQSLITSGYLIRVIRVIRGSASSALLVSIRVDS